MKKFDLWAERFACVTHLEVFGTTATRTLTAVLCRDDLRGAESIYLVLSAAHQCEDTPAVGLSWPDAPIPCRRSEMTRRDLCVVST